MSRATIVRLPLVHFVLLGGLLFGVKLAWTETAATGETIVVSSAEVRHLRAAWSAEMRRAPEAHELAALVRRHADEEILLREALRWGLDRSDPVVRRRLVQNMRFVRGADSATEPELLAEAQALGMARRDPVTRRRLMRALEERVAADVAVDDAAVAAYVARHAQRYGVPARVAFTQVFVSADRHGARIDTAAARVRAALDSGLAPGDPFLLGSAFDATEADIARRFGATFAQAVFAAPDGAWSGPIRSPFGLHFVRVDARAPAAPPEPTSARHARYALLAEREAGAVAQAVERLRRRYPLVVDWPIEVARAP